MIDMSNGNPLWARQRERPLFKFRGALKNDDFDPECQGRAAIGPKLQALGKRVNKIEPAVAGRESPIHAALVHWQIPALEERWVSGAQQSIEIRCHFYLHTRERPPAGAAETAPVALLTLLS